jgi:hypothetical protein
MRRTGANARFRESSRFKCSEAAVRIRPFGARQRKSRLTVSRLTWSYVVSGKRRNLHANRTRPLALCERSHFIGFEEPSVWVRAIRLGCYY